MPLGHLVSKKRQQLCEVRFVELWTRKMNEQVWEKKSETTWHTTPRQDKKGFVSSSSCMVQAHEMYAIVGHKKRLMRGWQADRM